MPKATSEDIIELTEVVEEGHPETPNLSAAKAAPPAREDALDDLDLEKEIDQIFADLNAPEETPRQGLSSSADGPERDTLDFDDLFSESDNRHKDELGIGRDADITQSAPPLDAASSDAASSLEQADDFERLFTEEPRAGQAPEASTHTESDPSSARTAPGDESEPLMESTGDVPDDVRDSMDHARSNGTDVEVEISQEEFAEASAGNAQDQSIGWAPSDQRRPDPEPLDQQPSEHNIADRETAGQEQTVLMQSLLHRLQALEDRFNKWEQRAQSPAETTALPEVDAEQLLARIDTRIAAAPTLILLTKRQESFEERLAGLEQGAQEPPQPTIDDLMARFDQHMDKRVGSRLDILQQAVDGMGGLAEAVARKLIDAELSRVSESMTAAFEEQLEQLFEQRLTERLELLKTNIIDDIERHLVAKADTPSPMNEAEPDVPRIAELAERLDGLQAQLDALPQRVVEDAFPAASQEETLVPLLQSRENALEGRLLETIRQEMEAVSSAWETQKNALAKDLENFLNSLIILQDKFTSLQGEWQTLREEREGSQTGNQEDVQNARAVQSSQDELGEILDARMDIRLNSLRTELHAQLAEEMHKAVPLAAAQIIREEIQALSQEEDEEEDKLP